MSTIFDVSFAAAILPSLIRAAGVSILAALAGFLVAVIGGLLFAALRLYAWPPISIISLAVIEFLRGTPLLVQLSFMFFVLPLWGITMPAMVVGIIGLGLHYSAYLAEVYRGGIESVPANQWEASKALNLSAARTFFRIILPQALVPVTRALGNYLIAIFKETPLLSAIAVTEMMQQAKLIGSETFRYTEPITLVGLLFLVMSLVSAAGVNRLDAWLRRRHA